MLRSDIGKCLSTLHMYNILDWTPMLRPDIGKCSSTVHMYNILDWAHAYV